MLKYLNDARSHERKMWGNLRDDSRFYFFGGGDIKPKCRGSFLVKWCEVVSIAEEIQTLGERGKLSRYSTLSRLSISIYFFLGLSSFHISNTNLYVHS